MAELLTCQVAMFIVTLVSYIRNHDGKRSRCWRRTAAMNCPRGRGIKGIVLPRALHPRLPSVHQMPGVVPSVRHSNQWSFDEARGLVRAGTGEDDGIGALQRFVVSSEFGSWLREFFAKHHEISVAGYC